jgi:crossover junction endodeoxyribonuclease RuvC
MSRKSTRIIGIDPGYERLGVAIIEGSVGQETLLFSTCLTTAKNLPFAQRLVQLGQTMEQLLVEYRPAMLAIEKLFFTKNQRTAMAVSETRGMIVYLAALAKLEISEFTPQQIKKTVTGQGGADKQQVLALVQRLIKLPASTDGPRLDDEIDAIAIALTASAQRQFPTS